MNPELLDQWGSGKTGHNPHLWMFLESSLAQV